MSTKLPPHANAAAHAALMEQLKKMSPAEIAKTAEKAGIYDASGRLTADFGGKVESGTKG
jgi:hypothetical protein